MGSVFIGFAALVAPLLVSAETLYLLPANMTCPVLSKTLQYGSRDAGVGQVAGLQTFLAEYFKLNKADIVSGYFGKTTQAYVKKFQQEQGLPAYGVAASLTRGQISKLCGRRLSSAEATNPATTSITITGNFSQYDMEQFRRAGASKKCSYIKPHTQSGIFYIANGIVRVDYIPVDPAADHTELLLKNNSLYDWRSREKTGIHMLNQPSDFILREKTGFFECVDWAPDTSLLSVPTNVQFKEEAGNVDAVIEVKHIQIKNDLADVHANELTNLAGFAHRVLAAQPADAPNALAFAKQYSARIATLLNRIDELQTKQVNASTLVELNAISDEIPSLRTESISISYAYTIIPESEKLKNYSTASDPTCVLTADKSSYHYGNTITLTWSTTNASYIKFVPVVTSPPAMVHLPTEHMPAQGSTSLTSNFPGHVSIQAEAYAAGGSMSTCDVSFDEGQ